MSAVLVIGALLVAVAAARWGLLRREQSGDAWLLSVSAAFTVLAFSALGLARAGRFGPSAVALCLVVWGALVGLGYLRPTRPPEDPPPAGGWGVAFVLLGAGALYAAFPTYYLLGGRDPGLYLVFAVRIATTGALDLDLPALARMHAEFGDLVPTHPFPAPFPGMYSAEGYGLGGGAQRILPQFMHLFPALGAVFHSVAGLEALVRTNAVVAVLGLWTFHRLLLRLVSPGYATAGVGALALGPAFVYWSRITATELLSFQLGFFGLLLLLIAHRRRHMGWALAAGLVLGGGVLNRLDGALWILAILGFALSGWTSRDRPLRVAVAAFLAFAVAMVVGFWDGLTHAWPYLHDLWGKGTLVLLARGVTWSVVACVLALLWTPVLDGIRRASELLRALVGWSAALLGLWLIVAVVVRPILWPESFNARAGWELCWYTTPFATVLAAVGYWAVTEREDWDEWLPLLASAAATIGAFTFRPNIFDDHIWASRRWVPHVIPFIILLATVGTETVARWLAPRKPRLLRYGLPALGGCYLVWVAAFAWPFLFVSMHADLRDGYAALTAHLRANPGPEGRPVLCDSHEVATALTYLYDIPTVCPSRRAMRDLDSGKLDGLRLVGADAFYPHYKPDPGAPVRLTGRWMVHVRKRWPRQVYESSVSVGVGVITARPGPLVVDVSADHPRLATETGRRDAGALLSEGRKGVLLKGPYLPLRPGRYEAAWVGVFERVESERERFGEMRVTHNKGRKQLFRQPLQRREVTVGGEPAVLATATFRVTAPVDYVELGVVLRKGVWLRLTRVRLQRLGD